MGLIFESISVLRNLLWTFLFWPVVLLAIILVIINIKHVRNTPVQKTVFDKKGFVISIGSKVGTGNIIGIMASLAALVSHNEILEVLPFWTAVGALIFLPLTYTEVFIACRKNATPTEYVTEAFTKSIAVIFAITLFILYAFGFAGYQFLGIQTSFVLVAENIFHITLNKINILLFVALPIIIFVILIIKTNRDIIFVNALTKMVMVMIVLYALLFIAFVVITGNHIGTFLNNFVQSINNTFAIVVGVPFGFVMALQRIIQASEAGLSTSCMCSYNSPSSPRESARLQVFATAATLIIAIGFTSYIVSYGNSQGMFNLVNMSGAQRILAFYKTIDFVTGKLGVFIMLLFFLLSGSSTVLGTYHFGLTLFKNMSRKNIQLFYLILISSASVFAIFNFDFLFDLADLSMLIVVFINILALIIICKKK